MNQPFFFKIGPIGLSLECITGCELDFDCFSTRFFSESQQYELLYKASVTTLPYNQFPIGKLLLEGKPWEHNQMDYFWQVHDLEGHISILVRFEDGQTVKDAMVVIDEKQKSIDYFINSTSPNYKFDVFFNPLGLLLFIYLSNFHGGFVMHASGVEDGSRGFLFSGLSGVGKSTMASLWKQSGATIINDDRLLMMPNAGRFAMYNTPMPYYSDFPRCSGVNALFLIRHSRHNCITPIRGVQALAKTMANCMQHFHSSEMVTRHLMALEAFMASVPIFELGFKPDAEIVKLVRELY